MRKRCKYKITITRRQINKMLRFYTAIFLYEIYTFNSFK